MWWYRTCSTRSGSPLFSEKSVSNDAQLVLLLQSLYDVKKVGLERKINGKFQQIQQQINNGGLDYKFSDKKGDQGNNLYRAWVETNGGERYYSNIVETFTLEANKILLHPVPATRGENIEVTVISESELVMDVFDLTGKFLFTTEQTGAIKYIGTTNLSPGVYIVHVIINGKTTSKKFIIH